MILDKNYILNALKSGELEADFDSWDFDEIFGVRHAVHDIKEVSDVQVAFPEHQELQDLREELKETLLEGYDHESKKYLKIFDEISSFLEGEMNDVYDYETEPKVLIDGQVQ